MISLSRGTSLSILRVTQPLLTLYLRCVYRRLGGLTCSERGRLELAATEDVHAAQMIGRLETAEVSSFLVT